MPRHLLRACLRTAARADPHCRLSITNTCSHFHSHVHMGICIHLASIS